jgi:hypothetical protein
MNALRDWLVDPAGLFVYLRDHDFSIGTGQALRAAALLDHLTQRGSAPQSSYDAARLLAPLLCTSAAEQASLEPLLREFAAAGAAEQASLELRGFAEMHLVQTQPARAAPKTPEQPSPDTRRARRQGELRRIARITLGIFIAILLLFAGLWLVPKWTGPPIPPELTQKAQPESIFLTYMTNALTSAFVGLRYALLPWFAWLLLRRFRDKLTSALRRLQAPARRLVEFQPRSDAPVLFGDFDLRISIQALRAHRQVPTNRLDVPRCLRATIAAGGRPILVQGMARRLPDYPILIEQLSGKDHLAALGRAIADRLKSEDVAVATYHYNAEPRILRDTARNPVTLADIAARHGEELLLLISDGDVLIDPVLGQVRAWVDEFARWRNPVLLTPVPLQCWSVREQALIAAGFITLPATPAGLHALGEFLRRSETGRPRLASICWVPNLLARAGRRTLAWHNDIAPDPEEREALLDALALSLPKSAFDLLCVLALFGEVRLDLTLAAGQALRTRDRKPLLNEESFAALAWLPWFRLGRMPDWLRIDLAQCLGTRHRDDAHKFYKEWLARLEPSKGEREKLLVLPDRRFNRWLARLMQAAGGRISRDVLFVRFMRKEKLDTLDLEAPQSLVHRLRRRWADPLRIIGQLCVLLTTMAVVFAWKVDSFVWSLDRLVLTSNTDLIPFIYSIGTGSELIFWHLRVFGVVPLTRLAWISDPRTLAVLIIASGCFVGVGWDIDVALVGLLGTSSVMALAFVESVPRGFPIQQRVARLRPRPAEVLAFAIMLISLDEPTNVTHLIWCCFVVAVGASALARFVSREISGSVSRLFLFGWFGACFGAACAVAIWLAIGFFFAFDASRVGFASATTLVPMGAVYGLVVGLWDHGVGRLMPMCGLTLAFSSGAIAATLFTDALGWPDAVLPVLPLYFLLAYLAVTRPQELWTRTIVFTCCVFVSVAIIIGFIAHIIGLDTVIRVPVLNAQYQFQWVSAKGSVIALSQMLLIPLAVRLHITPTLAEFLRSRVYQGATRVKLVSNENIDLTRELVAQAEEPNYDERSRASRHEPFRRDFPRHWTG